MKVKKRDGTLQVVDFNKISNRIKYLVEGYTPDGLQIGDKLDIDHIEIAQKICGLIIDGISTCQLDEFAAELCAPMASDNDSYDMLATRIIVSNHHKNTAQYENFSDMMTALYNNKDIHGLPNPLISTSFYENVMKYKPLLNEAVNKNHNKDYEILDYFGFKTLEKSYFLKVKNLDFPIQERYQHLLMRVALTIFHDDPLSAIEFYETLSDSLGTHATPTMFNSGTSKQQLSSCFLAGIDDSIYGMYECIRRLADISKWSGGMGIWLHKIRGMGSIIRGTNGESSGLLPLIKVLNEFARHVNQGGKRKGALSLYIEMYHTDIEVFLDMKKNQPPEEARARDLFYALWVCDLFMRRVKRALALKRVTGKSNIKWSLMCPDMCPGLADLYGDEFEELYSKYESEGRYTKQVDILKIWDAILDSQIETGGPYMLYKDHINRKSNQKNIGIIRSSNLCAEIVQYSDHEEYAVCNLASLNLKKMVKYKNSIPYVDFELLKKTAGQFIKSLNRVIDITYYPTPQAKRSNFKHRATGLGAQGLADVFILMGLPFESEQAALLNRHIYETIQYGAVEASIQLAEERFNQLSCVPMEKLQALKAHSSYVEYYERLIAKYELENQKRPSEAEIGMRKMMDVEYDKHLSGAKEIINEYQLNPQIAEYQYMNLDHPQYMGAYSTYVGSPVSEGKFQHDLWNVKPSGLWSWDILYEKNKQFGIRNSVLTAQMPTASTAHILGNNESIEPLFSNIMARQVLSGTFIQTNRYLQKALTKLGLWNKDMKNKIIMANGSIQNILEIPAHLRELFKTSWEMSKKQLINMSAERGPWICQSQSFNHCIKGANHSILTSIHMHAWEMGLKTGSYYIRTQKATTAQKFSVDIKDRKPIKKEESKIQSKIQPEIQSETNKEKVDPIVSTVLMRMSDVLKEQTEYVKDKETLDAEIYEVIDKMKEELKKAEENTCKDCSA